MTIMKTWAGAGLSASTAIVPVLQNLSHRLARLRGRAAAGCVMALACAWPAAPSLAAVVTQTASATRSSGPLNVVPFASALVSGAGRIITPASAQTLDFGGFDGTLGTLSGVQIAYTYQFTYQVSTSAYNPVPRMAAFYTLQENLTAPGATPVQTLCSAGGDPIYRCNYFDLSGRNALFVDVFTGTSPLFSQTVQVEPGSLQSYVSRPVRITIADPGSIDDLILSQSNPQFIANSLRIDTAVSATLTYNYIPGAVPEPGTTALMAGGVALLAFMQRKRRDMPARPANERAP